MTDRIQLLQRAFPGLPENSAQEVLLHLREAIYPVNTVLCQEGAIEDTFYLIVDGQVSIVKWLDFSKEERLLRLSEAGDFFGEMAIINDAPRAATVRTTKQTTVLEMDRHSFMTIIGSSPSMAMAMVRTTIDRMRSNDKLQFEQLHQTYESLQKLDKAKLDFIEVAAHELRTPLTIVQGYSKLLEVSIPDPNLKEAAQGMSDGVNRMLGVVNAMLDVSKIDNQVLKLAPVPVLTKLMAAEALSTFRKAIEDRRITIVEKHESLDKIPFFYADPVLVNKLFYQLISNAIKYSPDGGTIYLTSRETYDSRIGHGLHITLQDSGVGIPHENMGKIFDKFFQGGDVSLHSSSKTAFMGGGPGLGLAIASGIVKAHKGEIWAESEGYQPDKLPGTTFHILLPTNAPQKAT